VNNIGFYFSLNSSSVRPKIMIFVETNVLSLLKQHLIRGWPVKLARIMRKVNPISEFY
jgi:hypothetical protein